MAALGWNDFNAQVRTDNPGMGEWDVQTQTQQRWFAQFGAAAGDNSGAGGGQRIWDRDREAAGIPIPLNMPGYYYPNGVGYLPDPKAGSSGPASSPSTPSNPNPSSSTPSSPNPSPNMDPASPPSTPSGSTPSPSLDAPGSASPVNKNVVRLKSAATINDSDTITDKSRGRASTFLSGVNGLDEPIVSARRRLMAR